MRRRRTGKIYAAFTKQSGISVKVNTKDHNTFQEQINSYLQGTPDDVFNWFAGTACSSSRPRASPPRSTTCGEDRRQLPDAMKKLSKGRTASTTSCRCPVPVGDLLPQERLRAARLRGPHHVGRLRRPVQADEEGRLVPIAFGDKDAWPALGTFDQINFRQATTSTST